MPSSPIHGRRRSNRIVTKKRASLVITLRGVQKMFPCLIVDRSKEGFRLRGNFNRWAKESWCFDPNSLSACCAWLLLSAGSPIGGRVSQSPKTPGGVWGFHPHPNPSPPPPLPPEHPAP